MPINQNYSEFLTSFHSQKFRELWPAQDYVLKKYSDEFINKSDVAIELPTGAGKTLIALLIAEAWRRENRKIAILSANKTLARQMEMEAQQLGIPAVLMEGKGIDIPSRRLSENRCFKILTTSYCIQRSLKILYIVVQKLSFVFSDKLLGTNGITTEPTKLL